MRGARRAGPRVLFLLLAAAAPLAGCAEAPVSNPNLHAPKLILDRSVDNMTEIYLHSAFGERAYDNLSVSVDNATIAQRSFAYSLDVKTDRTSFFLSVAARSGEARFAWNGMIDLDVAKERVAVAGWIEKKNATEESRTFALPYETILDKVKVAS